MWQKQDWTKYFCVNKLILKQLDVKWLCLLTASCLNQHYAFLAVDEVQICFKGTGDKLI